MREIFLIVSTLLKSINGIKLIDKDKKQIDNYQTMPAGPFPCILIKLEIVSTETVTRFRQRCVARLTTRLADNLVKSETSTNAPFEAVERSLMYFYNADSIFNALQGYTDGYIESIDRVSSIEEDRKDDLTVVRTVFEVIFEEETSNQTDSAD